MKKDNNLLNLDHTPTDDELKEFYKTHDFSTTASGYDFQKADNEHSALYKNIKKCFEKTWCEQMNALGGKGSFANFSSNYPVKILADADNALVSGSVTELLNMDNRAEEIIGSVLDSYEEGLTKDAIKLAKKLGKSPDDLTDDEIESVIDHFADTILATMMEKLMYVQSVKEVLGITHDNAAHEDFNSNAATNYSKIDFEKSWDHLRSDIGKLSSLDEIGSDGFEPIYEEDFHRRLDIELFKKFMETLDDTDRKIIYGKLNGKTQAQIAEELNFASQGTVAKHLNKILERYEIFKSN